MDGKMPNLRPQWLKEPRPEGADTLDYDYGAQDYEDEIEPGDFYHHVAEEYGSAMQLIKEVRGMEEAFRAAQVQDILNGPANAAILLADSLLPQYGPRPAPGGPPLCDVHPSVRDVVRVEADVTYSGEKPGEAPQVIDHKVAFVFPSTPAPGIVGSLRLTQVEAPVLREGPVLQGTYEPPPRIFEGSPVVRLLPSELFPHPAEVARSLRDLVPPTGCTYEFIPVTDGVRVWYKGKHRAFDFVCLETDTTFSGKMMELLGEMEEDGFQFESFRSDLALLLFNAAKTSYSLSWSAADGKIVVKARDPVHETPVDHNGAFSASRGFFSNVMGCVPDYFAVRKYAHPPDLNVELLECVRSIPVHTSLILAGSMCAASWWRRTMVPKKWDFLELPLLDRLDKVDYSPRLAPYLAPITSIRGRALAIAPATEEDFLGFIRLAGLCGVPVNVGPEPPPYFPVVLGVRCSGPTSLAKGPLAKFRNLRGLYLVSRMLNMPARFYPSNCCVLGEGGDYFRVQYSGKTIISVTQCVVAPKKGGEYWVVYHPYVGTHDELSRYVSLVCGHMYEGAHAPSHWTYYVFRRDVLLPPYYPVILPSRYDFISTTGPDGQGIARAGSPSLGNAFRLAHIRPVPVSPLFAIAHVP